MDPILPEQSGLPASFPMDDRVGFAVKIWEQGCDYRLFPEEEKFLSARAVGKRRRQYLLGRAAAHCAMASVTGQPPEPVLKTERGDPVWPEGLVGAITHSGDTAICAVGRREHANGLGVDLELLSRKVPLEITRHVCTPRELAWVKEREDPTEAHLRLRMVFSAKEAGFKAFFPVEGIFLGFKEAELTWDAREHRFQGRLLKSAGREYPSGYPFAVGCMRTRQFLFSYTLLPPSTLLDASGTGTGKEMEHG